MPIPAMPGIARRLSRALDALSVALAFLAGSAVFILAFLIVTDIVARRVFRFSLQGTDELGGYVLAMVGSLGLAYVLLVRGFTRIDVMFRVLPPMVRAALHVLAYVTLAGLAAFFAWKAASEWHETWLFDAHANTPLQTPLWIPQGLWAIGMLVFALSALIQALRALLMLFTTPAQVEAEYGLLQIEDELKDYRRSSPTGTPPGAV